MPRVNLVPPEERKRELRRQLYIFPIAGAILVLGALGGSYYYYTTKQDNLEQDLNLYKQNNANLSKQVAELERYEELKGQKQNRLNAVNSLYSARFRWSRMLDDMSFVIPENISLVKVTGKVPGAQTQTSATGAAGRQGTDRDLEFEGYTYAMSDVAIFMVRLALIPSLTDVTLSEAEVEKVGDELPVHFVINATLKQAGETQRAAVAPTTGEGGPSQVTPTTPTTPTGTTTGTGTTGRTTTTR